MASNFINETNIEVEFHLFTVFSICKALVGSMKKKYSAGNPRESKVHKGDTEQMTQRRKDDRYQEKLQEIRKKKQTSSVSRKASDV